MLFLPLEIEVLDEGNIDIFEKSLRKLRKRNNVSKQFGENPIDDLNEAKIKSNIADVYKPNFHTEEYFENMKKRLYTKNHEHYKKWESLGESYENWYWVNNKWKIYKQIK